MYHANKHTFRGVHSIAALLLVEDPHHLAVTDIVLPMCNRPSALARDEESTGICPVTCAHCAYLYGIGPKPSEPRPCEEYSYMHSLLPMDVKFMCPVKQSMSHPGNKKRRDVYSGFEDQEPNMRKRCKIYN